MYIFAMLPVYFCYTPCIFFSDPLYILILPQYICFLAQYNFFYPSIFVFTPSMAQKGKYTGIFCPTDVIDLIGMKSSQDGSNKYCPNLIDWVNKS